MSAAEICATVDQFLADHPDTDEARPVAGYDGYDVYRSGKVWSRKRGKFLSGCDNGHGYLVVCLHNADGKKTHKVHRLVSQAFHPNPEGLPCVDHIDHDRTNNNADNLRWVTHSTNSRNRPLSVTNTSGHQGVNYHTAFENWRAIWRDAAGKQRQKSFAEKEDAIAYRAARVAELYDRPAGASVSA